MRKRRRLCFESLQKRVLILFFHTTTEYIIFSHSYSDDVFLNFKLVEGVLPITIVIPIYGALNTSALKIVFLEERERKSFYRLLLEMLRVICKFSRKISVPGIFC